MRTVGCEDSRLSHLDPEIHAPGAVVHKETAAIYFLLHLLTPQFSFYMWQRCYSNYLLGFLEPSLAHFTFLSQEPALWVLPLTAGAALFLLLQTEVSPIWGVTLLQPEFTHSFSHSLFFLPFSPLLLIYHPLPTPFQHSLGSSSDQKCPGHQPLVPSSYGWHRGILSAPRKQKLCLQTTCECFQTAMGQLISLIQTWGFYQVGICFFPQCLLGIWAAQPCCCYKHQLLYCKW